jgi:hypothetical protein
MGTASTSDMWAEAGTLWGETPPGRMNFSQGMLVEVEGSKVRVNNYDFYAGEWIDQSWNFDVAGELPYTMAKRAPKAVKPQFPSGAAIRAESISPTQITVNFDQAQVPKNEVGDIVRLYRYDFINKATGYRDLTMTTLSEFYFLPNPPTITMTNTGTANRLVPGRVYELRVYAIDAYGLVSEDYLAMTFKAGGSVITPTDIFSVVAGEAGDPVSGLADVAGGRLVATVEISSGAPSREVAVIAALYDRQGRMVGYNNAETGPGGVVRVPLDIPTRTEGLSYRLFVWDGLTYMALADAFVLSDEVEAGWASAA